MRIPLYLHKDERNDIGGLSGPQIVGLAVGLLILSAIVPAALSSVFNASTDGWSPGAVSMWNVLPIIVIAALVLAFVSFKGKGNA